MPSLAEIYLARGRAESDAELRKAAIESQRGTQNAAIWGNTLSNIGQTVAQGISEYGRQKQNAPLIAAETENRKQQAKLQGLQISEAETQQAAAKQAAQKKAVTDQWMGASLKKGEDGLPEYDIDALTQNLTSAGLVDMLPSQVAAAEGFNSSLKQRRTADVNALANLAVGVANAGNDPDVFKNSLKLAALHGIVKPEEAKQIIAAIDADPAHIEKLTSQLIALSPEAQKLVQKPDLMTVNAGDSVIDKRNPSAGASFTAPAKAPIPPTELDLRKQVETERHNKAMEAKARVVAGGGSDTDVKEAVMGMKEGTIPPQLPGRASKEYTSMMAEARRQGFDLAGAATDWMATQKHVATLNGAQQTRLNQAVNQLPELLDTVEGLAKQWKGGKFPILNKANLALAKGGAYGQQAASIANQLDAQIADVNADLATVYMGGNSPTDHGLELAGKALKSEWDEKVLMDMVNLARKNVQTRQNSIRSVGVQGASPDNPYGRTDAAGGTKPLTAAELIKKYGGG